MNELIHEWMHEFLDKMYLMRLGKRKFSDVASILALK